MAREFIYAAILAPDPNEGGYVVAFPLFPEIITQGDSLAQALDRAADALDEAVCGRIRRGEDIPAPGRRRPDQHLVPLAATTAAKAALHLAMREAGLNKTTLATRLGYDEKEVRRLLDPHHPSKMPRLAAALASLGKRLAVQMVDAQPPRTRQEDVS